MKDRHSRRRERTRRISVETFAGFWYRNIVGAVHVSPGTGRASTAGLPSELYRASNGGEVSGRPTPFFETKENTMRFISPQASSVAMLLIGAAFLGGCASRSDMDSLRASIDRAQQSADQAKQATVTVTAKTDSATQAAENARKLAMDANTKSDQALNEAKTAEREVTETNTKIDQMFKKSMMK